MRCVKDTEAKRNLAIYNTCVMQQSATDKQGIAGRTALVRAMQIHHFTSCELQDGILEVYPETIVCEGSNPPMPQGLTFSNEGSTSLARQAFW